MQDKKISGAFVVNLLKHLEIRKAVSHEDIRMGYVIEAITRLHSGFYQRIRENDPVGFVPNTN